MVELRQLRYFLAVAEQLSITEADRDLQMAQPALSQAIMKMGAGWARRRRTAPVRRLVPGLQATGHVGSATTEGDPWLSMPSSYQHG